MPRWGKRGASDKQEWERGLFGQLLSNSTGPPDPETISSLSRTRTGPSREQGRRQPERDNDNVYMLITCENMQQTEAATAARQAACNLPWGILFHTNWNYQSKEGGVAEDEGTETVTERRQQRRHGLLLCVPFKVNLPCVCACVCGHTNYNSNNNACHNKWQQQQQQQARRAIRVSRRGTLIASTTAAASTYNSPTPVGTATSTSTRNSQLQHELHFHIHFHFISAAH